MNFLRPALLIVTLLCACAARAEERIALVIGNGGYQHIGALENPVSDANLIAAALEQTGFQVTKLIDADQTTMKRGIADFGRLLRQAGPTSTALYYYAGHAVQSFGNNYLLPVDAVIRDQADLDLVGVEVDWVLRQLYSARVKNSIVILDACRNNPFPDVAGFTGEGLAEMNAPTGSFIAYATAPGKTALDGLDGNSPYSAALARAIVSEQMPIEQLFKTVRIEVLESTGGQQTPWDSSSLIDDFYFKQRPSLILSDPQPQPQPDAGGADLALWSSVKNSNDPVQLQLFLRAYPNSRYRAEAEAMLASLTPQNQQEARLENPGGAISFERALQAPGTVIDGKAIAELILGQPRFPPFEGIPDELWKGQQCSNCHHWTKDLLCEQGQFYLTDAGKPSLDKLHPYGGPFKRTLRDWAQTGCQ